MSAFLIKLSRFEVDTGAGDNFCSETVWNELRKPQLSPTDNRYEGATGDELKVLGTFQVRTHLPSHLSANSKSVQFVVVENNNINLLGRNAIIILDIDVTALMNASKTTAKHGCSQCSL